MPAKKLVIDFKGLVTAPGQLAAAPGALTTAENVDFPAPGIAQRRKGFDVAPELFTGPCWAAVNTQQMGANVLFNTGGAYGTTLQYGDGSTPAITISTPDGSNFAGAVNQRMKAAVSLRNHYLTSVRAPGRFQSDSSLAYAGAPRAPGVQWGQQNTTQLNALGSWLPNGFAVAYRVVWVTYDADGVEIVGAPSGRWVIANVNTTSGWSGAALSTELRVKTPFQADTDSTAITTSWRMRLYRSIATDVASAQPDDEMQLCYEASPSSAEITAGYMTVNDVCPESALGAYLYTNTVSGGDVMTGAVKAGSTGLGMAASNDRPPLARDVAVYADCAFWANFTTLQRLRFSILATGAGALDVGDVIDIDGTTFTAVAGAPASSAQFRVETTLGSVTLNLRQTAMNLVSSINSRHPDISAAYIGSDASPGTIGAILLEARTSTRAAFYLGTSGVDTCYLPSLANTVVSSQDVWRNGLAFSKPFQADAVPPANYIRVGRNDSAIQRVLPLRDALYVFTDDGIYWVRGSSPADFVVEAFDTTFRLLARDACVAIGDAIYAWGREGIARITNGGVEYLDLPIRNFTQACVRGLEVTMTLDTFASQAFAVAYPTQRRVLFFFPNGAEIDGYGCTRALVYNIQMGAWSTYRFDAVGDATTNNRLSGVVRWSDELLVCGEYPISTNSQLYVERNANDATDYADIDYNAQPVSIPVTLEWYAATPDPSSLSHWAELQVYMTPGVYPEGENTNASATVTADHGGTVSLSLDSTANKEVMRAMLSPAVGMASRLTVTVTQDIIDKYFGCSGFGLVYHPISHFVVR